MKKADKSRKVEDAGSTVLCAIHFGWRGAWIWIYGDVAGQKDTSRVSGTVYTGKLVRSDHVGFGSHVPFVLVCSACSLSLWNTILLSTNHSIARVVLVR